MAAGALTGSDGEHLGAAAPRSPGSADGAVCTTVSKAECDEKDDTASVLDSGVPEMTPEMIRECCIKNQGYAAPELNNVLILHYKGFRRIQNLAPYINVVTIWLECNGISKIDGFGVMPNVTSLYLQSNVIKCIENLEGLTSLKYLNLANNNITLVSGLASLPSLEKISLASNKITEVDALRGFIERPSLQSVDVSHNYIEDGDAYVDFWTKALPEVSVLYLHQNPCSRGLKDYRRRMISSLKNLRWLDDRKIDELERVGCEAWGHGGKDAETEAKRSFILQERSAKERSFNNHKRIMQATAAWRNAQIEAKAARDDERLLAAAEMQESGTVKEGWVVVPDRAPAAAAGVNASRQEELDAKVREFLDSRPDDISEETGHVPATEDVAAETTTEDPHELAEEEHELQEAKNNLVPESSSGSGNAEAVEDKDVQSADTLAWTSFRDKRLGRLAAECRYDFRKVAAELSQEFSCTLDAAMCRQRYGELLAKTPKSQAAAECKEKYSGRAKDAPDLDPAAVKEVSQWWVRKLNNPRTQDAASLQTKPRSSTGCQDVELGCKLLLDRSEWADAESKPGDAATAHTALAVPVDSGMEKYSQYASAFSPPPRSAACEYLPEPPVADSAALSTQVSELLAEPQIVEAADVPQLRGTVHASGAELFELD